MGSRYPYHISPAIKETPRYGAHQDGSDVSSNNDESRRNNSRRVDFRLDDRAIGDGLRNDLRRDGLHRDDFGRDDTSPRSNDSRSRSSSRRDGLHRDVQSRGNFGNDGTSREGYDPRRDDTSRSQLEDSTSTSRDDLQLLYNSWRADDRRRDENRRGDFYRDALRRLGDSGRDDSRRDDSRRDDSRRDDSQRDNSRRDHSQRDNSRRDGSSSRRDDSRSPGYSEDRYFDDEYSERDPFRHRDDNSYGNKRDNGRDRDRDQFRNRDIDDDKLKRQLEHEREQERKEQRKRDDEQIRLLRDEIRETRRKDEGEIASLSALMRFLSYKVSPNRINAQMSNEEVAKILKDDVESELRSPSPTLQAPSSSGLNMHSAQPTNVLDRREIPFPSDTFSLMLIANYDGQIKSIIPVAIAWFVFIFQVMIYLLVFLNITARGRGNFFGLPENVTAPTRIAELIATLITVATQEDLRKALSMLWDGYYTCTFQTINNIQVSFRNWIISIACRAVEGILGPFITFILIMRSEELVDLLLNFSAIEFIAMLDEAIFTFALQGFLGVVAKRAAESVKNGLYYPNLPTKASIREYNQKSRDRSIVYFVLILIPLLIGWCFIFANQEKGMYSCKNIFVQFDDSVRLDLGYFTGQYKYKKSKGKIVYDLNVAPNIGGAARFQYCTNEKAWTFWYGNADDLQNIDVCESWTVRSSRSATNSYDIIGISSSDWYIRNNQDREIIVNNILLFCSDCDENSFCGQYGTCNKRLNQCQCGDGWYGLQCDFHKPCDIVEVDTMFDPFIDFREWSTTYNRLGSVNSTYNVNIYNRPVYYSKTVSSEYDLILFSGARWVLTSSTYFKNFNDTKLENLVEYLKNNFHGFWSDYEVSFQSDPVDFSTPTDLTASPSGLTWFSSRSEKEVETVLLCAECNNITNKCQSAGICNSGRRCDCSSNGASGALCQILPVGNGFCDLFFNVAEFEYDGGDCCQATCISAEYQCGRTVDQVRNTDYCSCIDPRYSSCPPGSDTCWLRITKTVFGEIDFAEFGYALALSADAKVLAIGEPGIDSVRVFRNDGSEWIQLGDALIGEPGSRFGESIALSGDGLTLVVGAPDFNLANQLLPASKFLGRVSVFFQSSNSWYKIDETRTDRKIVRGISQARLGSSIATTQDGRIIYFGLPFASEGGVLLAYEKDNTTQQYFQSSEAPMFSVFFDGAANWGSFLSMSNSGQVIALGGKIDGTDFVQVFRYYLGADSDGTLIARGSPIRGRRGLISGDGQTLAVTHTTTGAPKCQVYYWEINQGINGGWAKRGGDLNGYAAALTNDGLTVAVSVSIIESDASTIETFSFSLDKNQWNLLGSVEGGKEVAVVLSGENDVKDIYMLVGLPFDDRKGSHRGRSSVYQLINPKKNNEERCKTLAATVRFEITTDAKPTETIWELRDYFTKKLLMSGGPYDQEYATFVKEFHLPTDVTCAEFNIFDIDGDGICCAHGFGSYSLFYGGDVVKIGGKFDWSERLRFGNCMRTCADGQSNVAVRLKTDLRPRQTSWTLADHKTGSIFLKGGPYLGSERNREFVEEICLPSSICANFTIYDLLRRGEGNDGICCNSGFGSYAVELDGKRIAKGGEFSKLDSVLVGNCTSTDAARPQFSAEGCGVGESLLGINIRTDLNPSETQWFLYNVPDRINSNQRRLTLLKGGNYTETDKRFLERYCVKKCVAFEILDSGNDGIAKPGGYSLWLNGARFRSGGDFSSYDYVYIGDCDHITTFFKASAGKAISCSDNLRNSCTTNTAECANGGISILPSGKNAGDITLSEAWTVHGAYSMTFGSDCNVLCSGKCSYATASACTFNELPFRLFVYIHEERRFIRWSGNDEKGNLLFEGDVAEDSTLSGKPRSIIQRSCVPRNSCFTLSIAVSNIGLVYFIPFINGRQLPTMSLENAVQQAVQLCS